MTEGQKGVLAMVVACTVWGLSGIYYKALAHVPAAEVLAHRTLWSLVFFGAVLAVQGRLGELVRLLSGRRVGLVALAAAMISANWFMFIWSVQTGRALEASLGYYIFPLVAVMIGFFVFRERLDGLQWAAVGLAAVAVLTLAAGLGAAPWIALLLASTFGAYGLLKRRVEAGPVVSVAAEVALLGPLAAFWLWGAHSGYFGAGGGAFGRNLHDTVMLAFSGVITGGPLMLFSFATKRVRMATIGLVQYLNPTLQFAVAVMVFAEPVTLWHLIAFPMIWSALALYSVAVIRSEKRRKALVVAP